MDFPLFLASAGSSRRSKQMSLNQTTLWKWINECFGDQNVRRQSQHIDPSINTPNTGFFFLPTVEPSFRTKIWKRLWSLTGHWFLCFLGMWCFPEEDIWPCRTQLHDIQRWRLLIWTQIMFPHTQKTGNLPFLSLSAIKFVLLQLEKMMQQWHQEQGVPLKLQKDKKENL